MSENSAKLKICTEIQSAFFVPIAQVLDFDASLDEIIISTELSFAAQALPPVAELPLICHWLWRVSESNVWIQLGIVTDSNNLDCDVIQDGSSLNYISINGFTAVRTTIKRISVCKKYNFLLYARSTSASHKITLVGSAVING